jgi:DNA topoisomerase I
MKVIHVADTTSPSNSPASRPARAGGKALVIVESPSKAKTIAGFLGSDFIVESSIGHIRDLPRSAADVPAELKGTKWAKLGVDVDNDFAPLYIVASEKKAQVAKLRAALKEASALYLATDEDREGESIAWHLLEVLKPKVPVKRMVFHEITRPAIMRAVEESRDLDKALVEAQEARRILDRLYGYEVSPVLWKKIMPGLSAGRVQSVATRLVVERERARMRFRAAGYWDLEGSFASSVPGAEPIAFAATMISLDGRRLASGRDFGEDGVLKTGSSVLTLDEATARALVVALDTAAFAVRSVEDKPYRRSPYAPFMTSTLQQEAGRKLRMSSKTAMRVAQSLYENGYITYMRTDSTTLSDTALAAARAQVVELYGREYLPDAPRRYEKKVKNAQEAHEAIRPAGESFRTPASVRNLLALDEFKLYELIWMRTVASQMNDARGTSATVKLGATTSVGQDVEFSASGKVITFPGFLRAYVEGADDPDAELEDREIRLPEVSVGDPLRAEDLDANGHSTQPPARYTEASLVKALEEMGVGRPSTYASIIGTIQDRDYVFKKGSALVPTFKAFAVIGLLERHFADLVDYAFTARMEDDLDAIATGASKSVPWLRRFYFGDNGPTDDGALGATVPRGASPTSGAIAALGLVRLVNEELGSIDAAEINSIPIGVDAEGREIVVKPGRYGPYLKRGDDTVSVPDNLVPDELTVERATEMLAAPKGDRVIGVDPASGLEIFAKTGRFGPYVQLGDGSVLAPVGDEEPQPVGADPLVDLDNADGLLLVVKKAAAKKAPAKKKVAKAVAAKPKAASLFATMTVESVTLEEALLLLSLPRVVGADPADGQLIEAANGKFGPYLRKGTDSRSLGGEEQLFTVTLAEALALYAEPKQRRGRGQGTAAPPLAELGPDLVSGKPMVVKEGRFGAYVTDGETNASLRKGDDPGSMTGERGSELLADRRAKIASEPTKTIKRGSARAATKAATKPKVTTKKVVAKKSAAKKTAVKKTAVKKAVAKKS